MQKKIVKVQRTRVVYGDRDELEFKYKTKNNQASEMNNIADSEAFYAVGNNELQYILQCGSLHYLSNQEYKVFQYHFKQGFNLVETSKLMRIKPQTIKNYTKRIGEKLKEIIDLENDYQNRFI